MKSIQSIDELLSKKLSIPNFQRPYKWDLKNISDLLTDIESSIYEYDYYGGLYRYRVGTIILYKNEEGEYEIVDGQQRIISFAIIKICIEQNFDCHILNHLFINKITQYNIKNNYNYVKEWMSRKNKEYIDKYKISFCNILEVVVIEVKKIIEAFQLFDSQNTRGKTLDPHDLLKAYHLREMKNYPYEMEHVVKKWEENDTLKIKELFNFYLFPIWNWSHRIKSKEFTSKEIDIYKGISEKSIYTYARRASKAMPYFQISEPFVSGKSFFEMVEYYLQMLNDIEKEMHINKHFSEIKKLLWPEKGSTESEYVKNTGFGYAKNLFLCALLFYYDKFHNFDEASVKKLFTWALMIRVDMESLGFDTINKYAIGEDNDNNKYSNIIPLFFKINLARMHIEISNTSISIHNDKKTTNKWNDLYVKLSEINGQLR